MCSDLSSQGYGGPLRHFGRDGGDRTDRGDIVRLMQGRKRNKRREVAHHAIIDQHRLGTGDTAMDDAVADAREARLTAEVRGKTDLNTAQRPN